MPISKIHTHTLTLAVHHGFYQCGQSGHLGPGIGPRHPTSRLRMSPRLVVSTRSHLWILGLAFVTGIKSSWAAGRVRSFQASRKWMLAFVGRLFLDWECGASPVMPCKIVRILHLRAYTLIPLMIIGWPSQPRLIVPFVPPRSRRHQTAREHDRLQRTWKGHGQVALRLGHGMSSSCLAPSTRLSASSVWIGSPREPCSKLSYHNARRSRSSAWSFCRARDSP